MAESQIVENLVAAERLLVAGEDEYARDILSRLAEDLEEYVDRNCPTTDEQQWFSFPTIFERLAYRRVEEDPRELLDVGEPFDRVYADLAFACVRLGDYDAATEALKQAVRWNPMDCGYRLDLGELFRSAGNMSEYLALSFSVFERASHAAHIVRAYLNFAGYFQQLGRPKVQAACLRAARRIDPDADGVKAALRIAAGTDADPDTLTDAQAAAELAGEGLPEGANAEVAVCLLMCASDAAADGDRTLATELTVRARDLVGAPAAAALLELIRDAGAEAPGQPEGGEPDAS